MSTVPVLRATLLPGLTPYRPAWRLQERLAAARAQGQCPDVLLLLQHPPVYTVGRSGRDSEILLDEPARRRRGVEVYHIDRGGRVTYHGPGQLVGYGIVDLGSLRGGLRRYVRSLEAGLVAALARMGVPARREDDLVGVWVGNEKIAAIGIRVSRGITRHGFALNVDPDLSYFEGIIPCGIRDRGVTSVARLLGEAPPWERVARMVAEELAGALGRGLEWVDDPAWLAHWGWNVAPDTGDRRHGDGPPGDHTPAGRGCPPGQAGRGGPVPNVMVSVSKGDEGA